MLIRRILLDRYSDSDEPSKNHRELFFDIEVEVTDGFPEPAKANNKILSVFQNRRWDWDFLTIQKAVKEGKMNSNQDWSHPPGSNLIGWVKRYSNSPITYLQPGDDPVTWQNPHFITLLKNAVRWTASNAAITWAQKS